MPKRAFLSLVAALVMMVSAGGAALATDPASTTNDVTLTITENGPFSVEVVRSINFPDRQFTLGPALNYTAQASYWLKVTDMRGTGAGWKTTASASPFNPNVPGSALISANNGIYTGCYLPGFTDQGAYCSGPNAVAVGPFVHGSDNITTGAAQIFASTAGQTAAPSPYGTGAFETQETLYYVGFPNALQVGTYTSTVTFTLYGSAP